MTINLSVPEMYELKPRITVFGVGGAGGNAVNNMIECGLEGVEFVVANTDAQALAQSKAQRRIQMGETATQGLGAGSHPEVGRAAAEEALQEIRDHLSGCHMVFVTAGMGGGTGTGAAPVIAQAAKDLGILTVAVVTKPFQFEGARRMRIAEVGLAELEKYVDTLLVIPNQNLFRVANAKTTFAEAFAMADQVLFSGVGGITDLMVAPGLINLDFADVRAVMGGAGPAMMGTGEASGEFRANEAAEAAISNPLLEDVSMAGAKGVLINIIGGSDLTLYEVDEAANRVRAEVDPDANIIVGSTFDASIEGKMRVSVVATGVRSQRAAQPAQEAELALGAEQQPELIPALAAAEAVSVPAMAAAAGNNTASLTTETPSTLSSEAGAEASTVMRAELPAESLSLKSGMDEEPLGKEMAEDAFIAPPAAKPAAKQPLVAARDTTPPQNHDVSRLINKGSGLLARMGWLGRNKRVPAEPPAKRIAVNRPAAGKSESNPAARGEAPLQPAMKIGNTSEIDIPAFLRRTAN